MVKKTHRLKKRNKSIKKMYSKKTKKRTHYGGKKLTPSAENIDAIPLKTPRTPDMRLPSSEKGTSSPKQNISPALTASPPDNDDVLNDIERRLAILKGDDSLNTTPVINSPFHIPEYKRKPYEQSSRLKSPNFESQDVVLSETYNDYNSFSSENDKDRIQLSMPLATSFQVMGYDKHPFFTQLKKLPNIIGKKLPTLTNKVNLTIDAHGSIGRILNDNEKKLANHYLRIIEVGDYGGTVSIYGVQYYKILNDMLRNPNYAELFDNTHAGKELRIKAYKKLCQFINDSRKPRCDKFSYNRRGDDYFKLIHLTHDRSFSGDREDIDVREDHPITARTLTSFEHQGLFVPIPYNRNKTGMPYYTKEMFQLFPGTTFMSKDTTMSLVHNILPLAIERNERFNIFISSCNVSYNLRDIHFPTRDKSGISDFISNGKKFLFLISNLSQSVSSCVKFLLTKLYKGRETAYGVNMLLNPDDPKLTPEIVDAMDKVILCMQNDIFMKNYSYTEIQMYNAFTVSHYFLGSIIPKFHESHTKDTPNELVEELNKPNPFDTSKYPEVHELFAMARLYLIQELVDNLGTTLELAVSILNEVNKLYILIIETIKTDPGTNLLTSAEVDLYKKNFSLFLGLLYFLESVYDNIYRYYLPKLQNDKNNNKPEFRNERFINKPLYKKFLKLYKANSLFFDEHTDFMHQSSMSDDVDSYQDAHSYENVNPYKYKQRINIDDVRDRMPDKDKFLSDNKLFKNSNIAKERTNISV
jgi:hypothetical protein